jgi:hypothetical protein
VAVVVLGVPPVELVGLVAVVLVAPMVLLLV